MSKAVIQTPLSIATKIMPSGGTASTVIDSEGIIFDIPLSESDDQVHAWTFRIAGIDILKMSATGNGGGGIASSSRTFYGPLVCTSSITASGSIITSGAVISGGGFNTDGGLFYVDETGAMIVQYIEIANGLSSGGSISLYDLDISHPFTDYVGATTWSTIAPNSGIDGGLNHSVYVDGDNVAYILSANIGTTNPVSPVMIFDSAKSNGGTGKAALTGNEIAQQFSTNGETIMELLGNKTVKSYGILSLENSAPAPSASVDKVQLYGVDLSPGNATLGIETERAVAADASLASTHSLTIKINGTNYKIPLVSV